MNTKICFRCKIEKPANTDNFHKDISKKYGTTGECKACRKVRAKKLSDNGYYLTKEYKEKFKINKNKINTKRKLYGWKYPQKGSDKQLLQYMRNRIYYAIKNNKKTNSTIILLGIKSMEELWVHLESKFTKDMTRKNYGKWRVDHIKPCASFDLSDPEQQKLCFHYTNLQPLWANDNLKKAAKYTI